MDILALYCAMEVILHVQKAVVEVIQYVITGDSVVQVTVLFVATEHQMLAMFMLADIQDFRMLTIGAMMITITLHKERLSTVQI
jgi:hypothetical protein